MAVMEVENISGVEHPCPEPRAGSLSQNHPLACVALQCKWHAARNDIEWIDMTIFTLSLAFIPMHFYVVQISEPAFDISVKK